jgi:hypothetical protein
VHCSELGDIIAVPDRTTRRDGETVCCANK